MYLVGHPEPDDLNPQCIFLKNDYTGFIQASMSKIQGLFKDLYKYLQQLSRT